MKRGLFLILFVALLLSVTAPVAVAEGRPGSVHVVQPGETLASIARRYCTTWQDLYNLNASTLPNPNQLYPGMTLRVVNRCGSGGGVGDHGWTDGGGWSGSGHWGGTYDRGSRLHAQGYVNGNTYVVERGDTAYSIALRFGITTSTLGQANGINPWTIYAGQRLVIPGLNAGHGPSQPCQPSGGRLCAPELSPLPTVIAIPITPAPANTH